MPSTLNLLLKNQINIVCMTRTIQICVFLLFTSQTSQLEPSDLNQSRVLNPSTEGDVSVSQMYLDLKCPIYKSKSLPVFTITTIASEKETCCNILTL